MVETRLSVGAGARLDWLPQETILFEAARLDRRIDIDIAEGGTLLAVEAVLLGRQAMGEAAYAARLRDNWRVHRAGRLLHAEATRLSGDRRERDSLSLLAGAAAFATLLYVGNRRCHAAARRPSAPLTACRRGIGCSLVGDKPGRPRLRAFQGLPCAAAIVPVIELLAHAGRVPRLWNL